MVVEHSGVEGIRLTRWRASQALATGMLGISAVIFLATLTIREPGMVMLLLRAVAEASLVGGLADWFAVTALFRRPLGLPIPHTAILPANKNRIGDGLARFLDRHFLTPEVLLPELRSLRIADRAAAWLADRRNAAALADQIVRALPSFLRAVDDRQIRAFIGRALGTQLNSARLAPLLGRLVEILTATGYHQAVLDNALDYAAEFLARNDERLLEGVAARRRRWIPQAINREIARAMLRAAAELIEDLRNPEGAARQALLGKISEFAVELGQSSALGATAPSPRAILHRPEVREWIASSWDRLRNLVLRDLEAANSNVHRALRLMILSVGETLRADEAMRARLDATLEALVIEALPWRAELVRFVTEVVRQWEPASFSDRVEAAVGADLQYIRMNGTIVGGLVGGMLFLLAHAAG